LSEEFGGELNSGKEFCVCVFIKGLRRLLLPLDGRLK